MRFGAVNLIHKGGHIMNRELLEKPFTPEQLKQHEGNFGKVLNYVEGHAIIQRLNIAFNPACSFKILKESTPEMSVSKSVT